MNNEEAKTETTTPAEKPGFFKRMVNKLDTAMKDKADAQVEEGCCCASSDTDDTGEDCCGSPKENTKADEGCCSSPSDSGAGDDCCAPSGKDGKSAKCC